MKNKNVNYVIIAAFADRFIKACLEKDIYLWVNVVSIYDVKDEYADSCQKFFDESKSKGFNKHKEIELDIGIGHGSHYRPLKEWIDLIMNWTNEQETED